MKFSSPANIALASIALSSPALLSSPAFAHAAPTPGSLSPNPGMGYFGASPQFISAESPKLQFVGTPPSMKIAGRRRSLRRNKSAKLRSKDGPSHGKIGERDALGLGVKTRDVPIPVPAGASEAGGMLPLDRLPTPIITQSLPVQTGGITDNHGLAPNPGSATSAFAVTSALPRASQILGAAEAQNPKAATEYVHHPDRLLQDASRTVGAMVVDPVVGTLPIKPNTQLVGELLPERLPIVDDVIGAVGGPSVDSLLSSTLPHVPLPYPLPAVVSTVKHTVGVRALPVIGGLVPPGVDPLSLVSPVLGTPVLGSGGQLLNNGVLAPPNTPVSGPVAGVGGILGNLDPTKLVGSLDPTKLVGSLPVDPSSLPIPLSALPDVGKVIPNVPGGAIPTLPTEGLIPDAVPVSNLPIVPSILGTAGSLGVPDVGSALPVSAPVPIPASASAPIPIPVSVPPVPNGVPVVPGVVNSLPLPAGPKPALPGADNLPIPPLAGAIVPNGVPVVPGVVNSLPLPAALPGVGNLPISAGAIVPNGVPVVPGVVNSLPLPAGPKPALPGVGNLPIPPQAGAIVPNGVPVVPGVIDSLPVPSGPKPAVPGVGNLPISPPSGVPPEVKLPKVVGAPAQVAGSIPTPAPNGEMPIVDPAKPVVDPLKVASGVTSNPVGPIASATASVISAAPLATMSGLPLPGHPTPNTLTQPIDTLVPSDPVSGSGPLDDFSAPLSGGAPVKGSPAPVGHGPIDKVGSVLENAPGPVKDVKPVVKRATTDAPVLPLPPALVGNVPDAGGVGVVGQPGSEEEEPQERPGYKYQVGDWDGDEYDEPEDHESKGENGKDGHVTGQGGMSTAPATESPTAVLTQSSATPTEAPATTTPPPTQVRATQSPKSTTSTVTWGARGGRKRAWMSRLLRRSVAVPGVLPLETGLATNTGAPQLPRLGFEDGHHIPVSGSLPAAQGGLTSIFGSPALPTGNPALASATLSPVFGSPAIPTGSPVFISGNPLPTSSVYLSIPSHATRSDGRSASLMTLRSVSMISIQTVPTSEGALETASGVPAEMGSAVQSLIGAQTARVVPSQTGVAPTQAGPHGLEPSGLVPIDPASSLDSISSSSSAPIPAIVLTQASQSTLPPDTYTGSPLVRTTERSASQTRKAPSRLRTMLRSVVTPTSTVAITGGNTVTPMSTGGVPSPTGSGTGTHTASSGMGATRMIFRWGVPSLVTSTIGSAATGQVSK